MSPSELEPRRNDPERWRIACINWSHATAPKAVAYYGQGREQFDRYFKTWAEAVAWTDEIVRHRR